uniref:Uncharacterized protein n=1 Tax=Ascaris lumbricoides TaxID=6252 RepID=A0A9J2PEA6_ASCLU
MLKPLFRTLIPSAIFSHLLRCFHYRVSRTASLAGESGVSFPFSRAHELVAKCRYTTNNSKSRMCAIMHPSISLLCIFVLYIVNAQLFGGGFDTRNYGDSSLYAPTMGFNNPGNMGFGNELASLFLLCKTCTRGRKQLYIDDEGLFVFMQMRIDVDEKSPCVKFLAMYVIRYFI